MVWELEKTYTLECGCICEDWENDKMTYMAQTEHKTYYKYKCDKCTKIDKEESEKHIKLHEQRKEESEKDYQEHYDNLEKNIKMK